MTETAAPTAPADTLPAALVAWIAETLGGAVTGVDRVTGGASRLSYLIRHCGPAGGGTAFLRRDTGTGQLSGTAYNLEREAAVLAALSALPEEPVAVPAVLGFNAEFQSVLMQRVDGTADFFGVADPTARAALEAGLIDQLAQLHALPLGRAGHFAPRTRAEAVRAEIALWRDLYRARVPVPDPALDLALDWLDRTAPGAAAPAALVHGDIGPGNFMFQGDRITALIDWELVHPGHPLEDLASVIARTLGIPFGTIAGHIAAYERASGTAVDRDQLVYCMALVLTRFCIGMAIGLALARPEMDLPMLLRFMQANRHALLRLLARQNGVAVAAAEEAAAPGPSADGGEQALYDHAIAVLEQLAGSGDGPNGGVVRHRGLGAAGLLRFLRDLDAYGGDRWRREQRDGLAALLDDAAPPGPPADLVTACHRFAAAVPGFDAARRRAALAHLLAQSTRRHLLMRAALGPMFDRSIDLE